MIFFLSKIRVGLSSFERDGFHGVENSIRQLACRFRTERDGIEDVFMYSRFLIMRVNNGSENIVR